MDETVRSKYHSSSSSFRMTDDATVRHHVGNDGITELLEIEELRYGPGHHVSSGIRIWLGNQAEAGASDESEDASVVNACDRLIDVLHEIRTFHLDRLARTVRAEIPDPEPAVASAPDPEPVGASA